MSKSSTKKPLYPKFEAKTGENEKEMFIRYVKEYYTLNLDFIKTDKSPEAIEGLIRGVKEYFPDVWDHFESLTTEKPSTEASDITFEIKPGESEQEIFIRLVAEYFPDLLPAAQSLTTEKPSAKKPSTKKPSTEKLSEIFEILSIESSEETLIRFAEERVPNLFKHEFDKINLDIGDSKPVDYGRVKQTKEEELRKTQLEWLKRNIPQQVVDAAKSSGSFIKKSFGVPKPDSWVREELAMNLIKNAAQLKHDIERGKTSVKSLRKRERKIKEEEVARLQPKIKIEKISKDEKPGVMRLRISPVEQSKPKAKAEQSKPTASSPSVMPSAIPVRSLLGALMLLSLPEVAETKAAGTSTSDSISAAKGFAGQTHRISLLSAAAYMENLDQASLQQGIRTGGNNRLVKPLQAGPVLSGGFNYTVVEHPEVFIQKRAINNNTLIQELQVNHRTAGLQLSTDFKILNFTAFGDYGVFLYNSNNLNADGNTIALGLASLGSPMKILVQDYVVDKTLNKVESGGMVSNIMSYISQTFFGTTGTSTDPNNGSTGPITSFELELDSNGLLFEVHNDGLYQILADGSVSPTPFIFSSSSAGQSSSSGRSSSSQGSSSSDQRSSSSDSTGEEESTGPRSTGNSESSSSSSRTDSSSSGSRSSSSGPNSSSSDSTGEDQSTGSESTGNSESSSSDTGSETGSDFSSSDSTGEDQSTGSESTGNSESSSSSFTGDEFSSSESTGQTGGGTGGDQSTGSGSTGNSESSSSSFTGDEFSSSESTGQTGGGTGGDQSTGSSESSSSETGGGTGGEESTGQRSTGNSESSSSSFTGDEFSSSESTGQTGGGTGGSSGESKFSSSEGSSSGPNSSSGTGTSGTGGSTKDGSSSRSGASSGTGTSQGTGGQTGGNTGGTGTSNSSRTGTSGTGASAGNNESSGGAIGHDSTGSNPQVSGNGDDDWWKWFLEVVGGLIGAGGLYKLGREMKKRYDQLMGRRLNWRVGGDDDLKIKRETNDTQSSEDDTHPEGQPRQQSRQPEMGIELMPGGESAHRSSYDGGDDNSTTTSDDTTSTGDHSRGSSADKPGHRRGLSLEDEAKFVAEFQAHNNNQRGSGENKREAGNNDVGDNMDLYDSGTDDVDASATLAAGGTQGDDNKPDQGGEKDTAKLQHDQRSSSSSALGEKQPQPQGAHAHQSSSVSPAAKAGDDKSGHQKQPSKFMDFLGNILTGSAKPKGNDENKEGDKNKPGHKPKTSSIFDFFANLITPAKKLGGGGGNNISDGGVGAVGDDQNVVGFPEDTAGNQKDDPFGDPFGDIEGGTDKSDTAKLTHDKHSSSSSALGAEEQSKPGRGHVRNFTDVELGHLSKAYDDIAANPGRGATDSDDDAVDDDPYRDSESVNPGSSSAIATTIASSDPLDKEPGNSNPPSPRTAKSKEVGVAGKKVEENKDVAGKGKDKNPSASAAKPQGEQVAKKGKNKKR